MPAMVLPLNIMLTDIKLAFSEESATWTVVIDGVIHRNLTPTAAGELIEYTMVAAEQAEQQLTPYFDLGEEHFVLSRRPN
jgi:hypothetical protein